MAGPRLFDHDEAVRLHEAGLSYAKIGERLGVCESAAFQAVKRATDPVWAERSRSYHRAHQRVAKRTQCAGGCGRLVWKQAGRTNLCPSCHGKLVASPRVRDGELQCADCGEWKPDGEFHRKARGAAARRGRTSQCKPCATKARQAYRERRKQPCVVCGAPALPPEEKGARGSGPPRCRPCYYASDDHKEQMRAAIAARHGKPPPGAGEALSGAPVASERV